MVVYASHGAGHAAARERRVVLGKRQEVIVLALAGGLSVELPMERAHELLRPLASGGAVLDADSYAAGRASDSKRRPSTLSMIPYSTASSAVMK